MVDVRGQPRRALVAAMPWSRRCFWRSESTAWCMPSLTTTVSERRGRAPPSQRQSASAQGGGGRLPRAEPRLHDRHQRRVLDRRIRRGGFPGAGQLAAFALVESRIGARLRSAAPKPSGCATTWRAGSRAITSRRARPISIAIFQLGRADPSKMAVESRNAPDEHQSTT